MAEGDRDGSNVNMVFEGVDECDAVVVVLPLVDWVLERVSEMVELPQDDREIKAELEAVAFTVTTVGVCEGDEHAV